MNHIINQVKDSPKARVYILVAFFFVTILIFMSFSGDDTVPEEKPKSFKLSRDMDIPGEQVAGGLGAESGPDPKVQEIVDKMKPKLEEQSGLKFSSLDVLSYKRQVVAGLNYWVKAKGKTESGDEKIVHLRIYNHFSGSLELTQFQLDKKVEDKIEYFQ